MHTRAPWLPATVGALVGIHFAALVRFGRVRLWKAPRKPLHVVITGATKGIGKAMAREFALNGDRLLITSRDEKSLAQGMAELRAAAPGAYVAGATCDVSKPEDIAELADVAARRMGRVDVWVNNAGYSGSFMPFVEHSPESLQQVVMTNLVGTLLCTQAAVKLMQEQGHVGHVFNMDGAGADGAPTPQYAAYGATKSGVEHMVRSVRGELRADREQQHVRMHTLSPGMVLTNLLLENSTAANKQVFNILCEQPETVAAYLVTRIRTVVATDRRGTYIRYLTPAKALGRFLTAPTRVGRFFDTDGNPVYPEEQERLRGRQRKVTQRLAAKQRRRTHKLSFAYALSMSLAFWLVAGHTMAG